MVSLLQRRYHRLDQPMCQLILRWDFHSYRMKELWPSSYLQNFKDLALQIHFHLRRRRPIKAIIVFGNLFQRHSSGSSKMTIEEYMEGKQSLGYQRSLQSLVQSIFIDLTRPIVLRNFRHTREFLDYPKHVTGKIFFQVRKRDIFPSNVCSDCYQRQKIHPNWVSCPYFSNRHL